MAVRINFDGLCFPLDDPVVVIDNDDETDVEGAGLTWALIEGRTAVTIELKMRDQEPMRFSLVEQDDGGYELITPDVRIAP